MTLFSRLALKRRSRFPGVPKRRGVGLIVVALVSTLATHTIATRLGQTQMTHEETPAAEVKATIHAAKRGNPEINLRDGYELSAKFSGNPARDDSPRGNLNNPQSLAAADFDEDGTPDLVCGYKSGKLALYRGNADSKTPNSRAAQQHIAQGTFTSEPFLSSVEVIASPESAEIAAGDFNADGHQDILAYAAGTDTLYVLSGSGQGKFGAAQPIKVAGQIGVVATGEIGLRDGQTDIAVAITNRKGSQLLVFEYPEGAFKHKPEVFGLPVPATSIAIGNLDADFYADIAVASGSDLTIVHGRGQAYPWDLAKHFGIQRPRPFVATRQMPFGISAMITGRFGNKRGETLAMLGEDGNIYQLEPNRQEQSSTKKIRANSGQMLAQVPFVPSDAEIRDLATFAAPQISQAEAETRGIPMVYRSEMKSRNLIDSLKTKQTEAIARYKNTDEKELESLAAEGNSKSLAQTEKAKAAFLRTLAGKPSTLSNWKLETLVSGSQFASAAASNLPHKMLRVNVSDSNLDDLLVLDSNGNQIQLARVRDVESKFQGQTSAQVTALKTEDTPLAVLPLRLNMDALCDLVVLQEGSPTPSVVMTAPAQTLIVTSADDTGDCQPGNPCSLRNAILFANSHAGVDTINFDLGGPATITPSLELPTISEGVNLFGTVNGNGQPDIEITGVNAPAPANGLSIRSSNSFIFGLTINLFKSTTNGQSQIGGSGIAIFSNSSSPNTGNNVILLTFLGTDRSGSLDKGNDATGLNIFDSDSNEIVENLISGNGKREKAGAGIAVTAGNSNVFKNNVVGLNSLGTGKLGNSYGMFLLGSNNEFGGDGAGDGNTVSGNGEPRPPSDPQPNGCDGVGMNIVQGVNLDTGELLTLNNTLKGNRLGTNPAGTLGFGNCWVAVATTPLTQTTIGSITQAGRNVVSDNGLDAIACDDYMFGPRTEGGYCSISGNNIGTDVTGTIALPNDWRNQRDGTVFDSGTVNVANNFTLSNVGAPGGTTPNGACTGFCNLISGNGGDGIAVFSIGVGTVGVFDNFVGTNQSGTQSLPNDNRGIVAQGLNTTYVGLGVPNDLPFGNLVSGNGGAGVVAYSTGNNSRAYILGNLIGTDTSGTFAISNDVLQQGGFQGGIFVFSYFGDQFVVGGTSIEERNIVSGNTFDNGISVFDLGGNTKVINNLIGLNKSLAPLGNGGSGIFLQGFGTQIEGNQIAYNGTLASDFAGVLVSNSGFSNTIRNNSIYDNSGLGIDLTGGYNHGDGVTANDCQDSDSGVNEFQNFPLLDAPVSNGDGTVTVTGVLLSRPFDSYTVDFYSNTTADSSGHGEGANFLGSLQVHTDDHGLAALDFTSSTPVSSSLTISATATDAYGNTSEFSCNAGATCSDRPAGNMKDYRAQAAVCFAGILIVNVNTDEPDPPAALNNNICDVDPNTSGDQCTLRAAIQVAEHRKPQYDIIDFAILGAGVHTIAPSSPLPLITDQVTIDGTSQPGYNGSPLIELSGVNSIPAPNFSTRGLDLEVDNSTIRGLAINRFNSQIGMEGDHNHIEACYIGLNPDGLSAPAGQQEQSGVGFRGKYITVGGDLPSDGNVISGNGTGIFWQTAGGVRISNNKIGTDKTGMAAIPNHSGIYEFGGLDAPRIQNVIEHNLISGNASDEGDEGVGINIHESTAPFIIRDNIIGANADLSAALPNSASGIFVLGNFDQQGLLLVTIQGNTIVGHNGTFNGNLPTAGILVTDYVDYTITDNFIGVTPAGLKLPNAYGVEIRSSGQNQGTLGPKNTICGNALSGVHLFADPTGSATNTKIIGNFIGVNAANDTDVGNTGNGIWVEGSIKGAEISDNVISGNQGSGIKIEPHQGALTVSDNKITGNFIGVNSAKDLNLGNAEMGIWLAGREGSGPITGNQIFENVISGNGADGILLTRANKNSIHDNQIGTAAGDGHEAFPNNIGMSLVESSENQIFKNTFSDNQEFGLLLGNVIPSFDSEGANPRAKGRQAVQELTLEVDANELYDNRISGSKVGLAVTEGAKNNVIGGGPDFTIPGQPDKIGNKIFNNTNGVGYGIFLGSTNESSADISLPSNNKFVGNFVGQDAELAPKPNRVGFVINSALNNLIGGSELNSTHNTIVANQEDGIRITGDRTRANKLARNDIGVCRSRPEDSACGNGGNGISAVLVGRRNEIKNNRVGWNRGDGICVSDLTPGPGENFSLVISSNEIGAFSDQEVADDFKIGNTLSGIRLENAQNVLIGIDPESSTAESRNIISANRGDGVLIVDDSHHNLINNSVIGTTETLRSEFGNEGNGIHIVGGGENTIGGVQSVGNEISGNLQEGIFINTSTSNNIHGNLIGVVKSVFLAVPMKKGNGLNGIKLVQTSYTSIGDPVLNGYRNLIGGNNSSGIFLSGPLTQFTTIKSNFIGTDTVDTNLGNVTNGIFITESAAKNIVGGTAEVGSGNRIAHNGGASVRADESAGCCNLVDPNSIYENVGGGIDVGSVGLTPNDAGDDDEGPNRQQNFPEFISATIVPGGNLVIQYKVDSAPGNSNYGTDGLYIEFFKGDATLQGQTFVGSTNYSEANYTAGSPGVATLLISDVAALGIQGGDKLVATATDADGNTSEFTSTNVGTVLSPTASTSTISGRVATSDGVPVAGVTINLSGSQSRKTISDNNGHYQFIEVETSGFYTVEPARPNFSFAPATRSFSVLGNTTAAAFTAVPDPAHSENPLDTPEFFVRQHYLDFLGREPDESGFNFWSDQLLGCRNDSGCTARKRVNVSAAYFLSIEFQETGGLVDGLYRVSYGRRPLYAEFMPDARSIANDVVVGGSGWQEQLATNKRAFVESWVQRADFVRKYGGLADDRYVDELIAHTGVNYSQAERDALLISLTTGTGSRASVLQRVAEDERFVKGKFNGTFVMMEYFGYLRRDPDESGYQFWLAKLNQFNGNFEQAEMVKAFILSTEYRGRFGP